MKKEKGSKGSTEVLINELVASGFQKGILPSEEVILAAPSERMRAYRVYAPERELFVKVYSNASDYAEAEAINYQYFRSLDFVPKLRYSNLTNFPNQQVFAYDFIDGPDLHTLFSDAREQELLSPTDPVIRTIDQTRRMDRALKGNEVKFSYNPWAVRSPIRQGFLPPEEENEFLNAYSLTFTRNSKALEQFPGFYFDRNPRNILFTPKKTYQVDFGVIEFASPIFDLAKLLRNGVDITKPITAENVLDFGAFTDSQEEYLKDYYFDKFPNPKGLSRNEFELYFNHAALHTHTFYITKYLKLLREGKGDVDALTARSFYHRQMGHRTIYELSRQGDQSDQLHGWIEHFVDMGKKPS